MGLSANLLVASMLYLLGAVTVECRILTKVECERIDTPVYYNEQEGACTLKLQQEVKVPRHLAESKSIKCPKNSNFHYSGSHLNIITGKCFCHDKRLPNEDLTACLQGKLQGEECNEEGNVFCSEYAGLKCSDVTHRCECRPTSIWSETDAVCNSPEDCSQRGYGAYYDSGLRRCFTPIHSNCYNPDNGEDFIPAESPPCPPDTTCTKHHSHGSICKCKEGYGADAKKRECRPVRFYGEDCPGGEEANDPCDVQVGLQCVSGKCACADKTTWDARIRECVKTLGSECDESNCGLNANCAYSTVGGVTRYSRDRICQCQDGFISVGGLCFAEYGAKCSRRIDCYGGMNCIDGLCACTDILTQKVSHYKKFCLNILGAPCTAGSALVPNAVCNNGTTLCAPGMAVSTAGTDCLLPYGKACSPWIHDETLSCNYEKGQACIDGTCKCVTPSLVFEDGIGCVAPFDGVCGEVTGASQQGDVKYKINCKRPTFCAKMTTSDPFLPRCRRLPEYY